MNTWLAVAVGGTLGAMSRHGVNVLAARWLGTGFPWGTLAVNIVGCFILGALLEVLALRAEMSAAWRSLIGTGFCGALTTFSAFSADVVALAERQQWALAGVYLAVSLILSIGAFVAGMALLRTVL